MTKHFFKVWEPWGGIRGGFETRQEEEYFRKQGDQMIAKLQLNPGPLKNKTIKIRGKLPYFWLSKENNIILCGKIDWLEYLEKTDSVHVIDFKTGKVEERPDSLQLPIYCLLASSCQSKPVSKASYWYLYRSDKPESVALPDPDTTVDKILEIARRISLARKLNHFKCSANTVKSCIHCAPLEAIVSGQATFVGRGGFGEELYFLSSQQASLGNKS